MPTRPAIAVAWPKPDYLSSIERAGGTPRILQPDRDPLPAALDNCTGILLTGGADVDPVRYGDPDRHHTVETDAARDEYEFALARYALERDLPLLAICRGTQLLNVVAGGTLVQDIPTTLAEALRHKGTPEAKETTHDADVVPGTCLARLLTPRSTRPRRIGVNSRHHQSVRTVAPHFVVSATAPDGIVEAIEDPRATFCVGVQWHPENYWQTGEFAALFTGLVEAARTRATG